MFDGRVQACELGLVVQHLIILVGHDFVELLFYIHDVDEIAVSIELTALQLQFQNIVMRVRIIFWSPVPADQVMSCYKVPLYSECIHVWVLQFQVSGVRFLCFCKAHDESSVFALDRHSEVEFVYVGAIIQVG